MNGGACFVRVPRYASLDGPTWGNQVCSTPSVGEDRVIVTPVPGTTRDVIEESINLDGLPLVLWDTAGIRDTTDEVERLGVSLSRAHLEKSEAVIVVLDGSTLHHRRRQSLYVLHHRQERFSCDQQK